MNEQLSIAQADLEIAVEAVRDVLRNPGLVPPAEGASLDRMLVHMTNMREAIASSPDRHANVAKRLNDFAMTTNRMQNKHPGAAPDLARLSDALLAASQRLQGSPAGAG